MQLASEPPLERTSSEDIEVARAELETGIESVSAQPTSASSNVNFTTSEVEVLPGHDFEHEDAMYVVKSIDTASGRLFASQLMWTLMLKTF